MIQLYTINIAILLSGNKRHPSLIFFFKKKFQTSHHSFPHINFPSPTLPLPFLYIIVVTGKSFVAIGSCFQIGLFFLFY